MTLSISKSWAESTPQSLRDLHHPEHQGCATEAQAGAVAASTSSSSGLKSSRSSGLMEQLMTEMDQVFHDILAEDVGNYWQPPLTHIHTLHLTH